MKILMVSPHPPTRCGIGAYALQEARHLRGQGHVVDVISPDRQGNVDFKADLAGGLKLLKLVVFLPFYHEIRVQYTPAFYTGLGGRAMTNAVLCLLFLLSRKFKLVCHEFDLVQPRRRLAFSLQRLKWKLARNLIFHTQAEVELLEHHYRLKLRSERCEIRQHQAHFVPYRKVSSDQARCELGLDLSKKLFLCIGFLQPSKGFDRALAAFVRVNPARAQLYVVGSSRTTTRETVDHVKRLRELAQASAGTTVVEKYLSDEEFDTWLTAADYVVLPYRESCSSGVVARAKLLSKPVIAAAVGGIPEQLDASTDHIFRSDEELVALFQRLM